MRYNDILNSVDPQRALKSLNLNFREQGAYLYFPCPKCEREGTLKAFGNKKNLWYCNHCKASGHIISLAMSVKQMQWEEAKAFLEKSISLNRKTCLTLNFTYELQYSDILEKEGITKETCERLHIGKPKGKTMLSGCIAFGIKDKGKLIAYFGIRMKDKAPVFHKSFNPELYLYNWDANFPGDEMFFTRDMFHCVRLIQEGKQAVCNFGLPYISQTQLELLKTCQMVTYYKDDAFNEIMRQVVENQNYFRFI